MSRLLAAVLTAASLLAYAVGWAIGRVQPGERE